LNDHEDGRPNEPSSMPPIPAPSPLPTDLVPETERKTDPAPADPVMRLLSEIASKVDSLSLDVKAVNRKVSNLAIEVNATKNQAAAATSEARAAHAATVVTNDMVNGIARILEEQTNAGLAELDRKLEKTLDRLTSTNIFHDYQIDHLMRWSQAHEGKQADDAHGIERVNNGPSGNGNGNGNGHDPEIELDAES
jgi:outer membrane murein-binding lipoprotein Lpp